MKRNKKNYLIKGIYGHPQISGYFVVKQYMMIEQDGKHCLLLRFQNELKTTVRAVEFTLKQLDAAGKSLGKITVAYTDLAVRGGALYVPEQGIVIHDDCVDVIVQMSYVISENVKYQYHNGLVTAHYSTRGFETEKNDPYAPKNKLRIQRKYLPARKLYKGIAWLSLLIMIITFCMLISKTQDVYKHQPDEVQTTVLEDGEQTK